MASSFTPQLKRLLQETGYYFVRQGKATHELWHSPITDRHLPVDQAIKSRHTAIGVFRQEGLPKAF